MLAMYPMARGSVKRGVSGVRCVNLPSLIFSVVDQKFY